MVKQGVSGWGGGAYRQSQGVAAEVESLAPQVESFQSALEGRSL